MFYYYTIILVYSNAILSLLKPVFYVPRLDIIQFLVLNTTFYAFSKSNTILSILDGVLISIPILLLLSFRFLKGNLRYFFQVCFFLSILFYGLWIDACTPIHFEVFIMFAILILLFIPRSDTGIYYAFHSIRYIFLYIFLSAGLWKLRAGGFWNIDQMSAILLDQHLLLLASNESSFFTEIIHFLISNYFVSYALYFTVTIIELCFIVGFFTLRWDKVLFIFLISFLIINYFLMEINYLPWMGYGSLLWFSKDIEEPNKIINRH